MGEKTCEQRISTLEAPLGDVDEGWEARLDRRLTEFQERVESRFARADSRMESVQRDVAVIKHAVKAILTRLP